MNLALQAGRRSGGLRRRIPLVVDHLHRAVQFLLGDEQRRIDSQRFLKLGHCVVEFAVVAQLLPVVDNRGRRFKTDAFERRPDSADPWA